MKAELTRVEIKSRAAWRAWLARHHRQDEAIWLVTYKKNAGALYVPYATIVEEALCFGWIDSLPQSLDALRSMRLLAPRKPKSAWSALNKERAAQLIKDGRMHASGLAKIEAAKADGSWGRLRDVERLRIPPDLARALAGEPKAQTAFVSFPPSTKRAILEWLMNAKTRETRTKRIAEIVREAKAGRRANQYRQPSGRGASASPKRKRKS